jgi:hypothetical protein
MGVLPSGAHLWLRSKKVNTPFLYAGEVTTDIPVWIDEMGAFAAAVSASLF